MSLKEGSFSAMVSGRTRRTFHLLVGAMLTIGISVIGGRLTPTQTAEQSWWATLGWAVAGLIVTFFYLRWQLRSQEESPEAIEERVSQLHSELRSQVQSRSYGARRNLIEAPLKELDLDIAPRVGWVRDPRLTEPETLSEENTGIVAAFASSKRRLLIVGEPGSGKTMAAYTLIEHLEATEGDERMPLLVNLSAWGAQDDFETFLVDYLVSEVGYQVRQRAVASAFIGSRRYTLILDGLDEIPAGLRKQFSEYLDEFVCGVPSEVAVVVTCRTQEYEELLATHPTGLGLIQAVEMLPLTSEQLDSAFVELAKVDKDWETFLSQRNLKASQRARDLLSNPLFLNLAVAGHLRPGELLSYDEEQELRDLVLERYLHHGLLTDHSAHEPKDTRRYLSWIVRFLNGDEVSPFGLKTKDSTVFDLADLTPPDPPKQYLFFEALGLGLFGALGLGLLAALEAQAIGEGASALGPLGAGLGFSVWRGLRAARRTGLWARLGVGLWARLGAVRAAGLGAVRGDGCGAVPGDGCGAAR
jgi:hypothetical protein